MKTTTEIIAMVNALAFAASSEDAPTGWWTAISIDDLRAAANRLAELERENARMRAALMYSHGAIDFYEKVQAASQDEKIAVGQDHWDWLIEAARRARAALAGSGE